VLNRNSVVFLLVLEHLVFVNKGKLSAGRVSVYSNQFGPVMSGARWVNLCKYNQCDRLHIKKVAVMYFTLDS